MVLRVAPPASCTASWRSGRSSLACSTHAPMMGYAYDSMYGTIVSRGVSMCNSGCPACMSMCK
jgi:hypothetical protein